MNSKEALKELKENAQEICEWELDRLNIIEKDLEVLEIIKEKRVDCKSLVECEHIDEYNGLWFDIPLNQEDFDLLKEWLSNE